MEYRVEKDRSCFQRGQWRTWKWGREEYPRRKEKILDASGDRGEKDCLISGNSMFIIVCVILWDRFLIKFTTYKVGSKKKRLKNMLILRKLKIEDLKEYNSERSWRYTVYDSLKFEMVLWGETKFHIGILSIHSTWWACVVWIH